MWEVHVRLEEIMIYLGNSLLNLGYVYIDVFGIYRRR